MKVDRMSKTVNWMMVVFFTVLILLGPGFLISDNRDMLTSFAAGVILALVFKFIMSNVEIKKERALLWCIVLSVLCFAIKFMWVYLVRIVPLADYETYFNFAKDLQESYSVADSPLARYVALFPHIFGYSWFLSLFMQIFGTGELVVPVINVVLTVIAGILIYRIAYKLIDTRAAVFAYLLWIMCPSQTIYNSLVFADLFYTTLVLTFILIITELNLSSKVMLASVAGILAGVVLRLINTTRPIAAVLIIAVFAWLAVLKTREWAVSAFRKKWIPFLVVMVLCYYLTGILWNSHMTDRLGQEGASTPGYSVMVGFNMGSLGTWNIDDSERLTHYSSEEGATAEEAQEKMLEDAKDRIANDDIDFAELFRHKFKVFLGADDTAVIYHYSVLNDTVKFLTAACNIFYYMLLALAVLSLPKLGKYSVKTSIPVVILYIIGLTFAQMLVEVAGRYHYSALPMLILLASFGLLNKKEKTLHCFDGISNSASNSMRRREKKMADILYVVVPCYNEQEVLPETSKRLKAKLESLIQSGKISTKSRIMLVNDGSKDTTWQIISQLHNECELFTGVNLTRNRGHQNALLAGLMTAKSKADVTVSMDADLQDDINAIDEMLDKYYDGCDIVYGVRSKRKKDSWFKRFTAESFYRVMDFFGAETVFNHADYRLMSKRALNDLENFKEVNLFLRGIVPMIGYKSDKVYYEREERFAGESKYPLKKMLSFAAEGITSLSTKPIRLITLTGCLIFFVSIIMICYFIFRWIINETVLGWASLICSVWAIGGLLMLSIGIIGEYVGKVYLETKQRPRFLIENVLGDDEKDKKNENEDK